ncbi:MAG: type II CRISPR-associated endonuclease Cas1 [Flavobacteriaceae bacterium]|nr:type II CRISPR-associated endonuclease Cas1 [Flavobacteriaceae bacterium]
MIKRTLFFGTPVYLSTKNEQLVVQFPEETKTAKTIPIEDIGMVVLEHPQITITNTVLMKLTQSKAAVLHCDKQHLPCGLVQPLVGHSEQNERMRQQLAASLPLQKQLWQQTVQAKIHNQAAHLQLRGQTVKKMQRWAGEVKSGDKEYHEATAAAYYFQHLFPMLPAFSRNQKGIPPNNLLNYGYAILRALCARALVSSGLFVGMGIHHANKYNAFCLADDMMEPYRPYVDVLVYELVVAGGNIEELNTALKAQLLQLPVMDVHIDGKTSPLMHAMSRTTSSLYDCFAGYSRKILYPILR